ncbi:Src kinase-associated phosphoprotein 2 [Hondaea fermentalgiana]|uniref:Src kinase-associated phosphoprotein 2 n=1 Tax=Hondaea fermentalgiana TaxID=2315210 RepID=A0A2R5GL34_9STRA|nr:Src kinase-associated phosphoprotein 2 [Hondaea fermentalgiana]|eukprot:GBG30448.1 Src kinase-associated phosphoprotein 2 [Hondaea fermentalgiana]
MSTKNFYKANGVLGVLMHLAETKLIFEDEYAVLLAAVTESGPSQIQGAEEIILKLMNKTNESYRAEDLFNLIGMLAKACSQTGSTIRQVKLKGNLAKLPFGCTGAGRVRKSWKTRAFYLADHGITYFAKQGDTKPKGQLLLSPNTYIRDASFSGRSHCFDIITRNGTLSISAESESEKELWVCGLARVIHAVRASAAAAQNVVAPSFSMASGSLVHIQEVESKTTDMLASQRGLGSFASGGGLSEQSASQGAASETTKGFLYKLAVKSRRNWKRRYFVLFRNLLSYFETDEDKRAKGNFFLDVGAQVVNGLPSDVDEASLGEELSADCCFHIRSIEHNYTLVLAATSPSERLDWIEAFQRGALLGDNLMLADQANVSNEMGSTRNTMGSPAGLGPMAPPPPPPPFGEGAVEIEVVRAMDKRQGSEGTSVGRLIVSPEMSLVAVRDQIHRELDDADLPLNFSFLLRLNRVVRMARPTSSGTSDSPLSRVLKREYTKVSRAQEELLGADRMIDDDCTLFIVEEDSSKAPLTPSGARSETWNAASHAAAAAAAARAQRANSGSTAAGTAAAPDAAVVDADTPGPSETSPRSLSPSASAQGAAAEELEALRAAYEHERAKWDKEIRKLRAELAESRNMILNLQRGGSGGVGGGPGAPKALSPLQTMLAKLQRDGYLEDTVSIKTLSRSYERTFEASDISGVLLVEGGPYEQLMRRHVGEPEHVRAFLEGLENVLQAHTISKVRLTQPWWLKKLKDVSLLRLDQAGLLAWAKSEPWTEDTEERYAFLMGKMRPGAVTEAHMTLLKPKPTSFDDDDSDDDEDSDTGAASDGECEFKEEVEHPITSGPGRNRPPAFLQSINALKQGGGNQGKNDELPKPRGNPLLQSIQGFDKARLAKTDD